LSNTATVLCAGQTDLLSNDPQEWGIWIDIHAMRFAVYGQLNRHRKTPEIEQECLEINHKYGASVSPKNEHVSHNLTE
jgi:hypothetical protein